MSAIRFHVNQQKPLAGEMYARLAEKASRLGIAVTDGDADVIVVLGGDGTFLHAVHEHPGVPLLGLNFGGLGYLCSVDAQNFERALERLAAGKYRISDRRRKPYTPRRAPDRAVKSRELAYYLISSVRPVQGMDLVDYNKAQIAKKSSYIV